MVSLLVAQAKNRVIGKQGTLPWYLPADLKRFRELTTGHSVIMGRKTFDSIIAQLGMPLPNRSNIILSRDKNYKIPGCLTALSLNGALDLVPPEQETFIIGGAQIFELAFARADRLYVTQVAVTIVGDTYFPEIDRKLWTQVSAEPHAADSNNPYSYSFEIYERKR